MNCRGGQTNRQTNSIIYLIRIIGILMQFAAATAAKGPNRANTGGNLYKIYFIHCSSVLSFMSHTFDA
jgi:hypothetical protein